ncbi:hypothetical protein Kpol_478p2 [Vanderwaltozyma polyspora DSM 70294]|uniref:Xaa-Pro aminopeptidase n=1 Tax=Vanderwaltozyma polyspora (strain ATCC 22028 / DSM 70294 / BCRC 21397 / CBS 2163 / NBRC 10782 / NRRL Y-8283 / UCD 57-17) TaxID=436907 RepID=A7TPM2_VANPO|nr:uncharacterized protein Kpol_478p2 [Vanderwaltozyma polyspora DSM 70294]EDO15767.1 hypothetical protein Kpol_478p2 [Vanderwaltozyma polyspora DSM 70294]
MSTAQSSRMAMAGGVPPSSSSVRGNRPFRPCDDCTCSPGLLSRHGKRSSIFFRQYENTRRRAHSSANNQLSASNESVYSSDTLCKNFKEVNTTERLLHLRNEMRSNDLCCYIVPSEDSHQSEYVSEKDERRSFISGFTGSAGIACITRDLLNFNDEKEPTGKSILSTDGRYFNQALQELDYNWALLRQGEDKLNWQQWCCNEAIEMLKGLGLKSNKKPLKIGIDPKLITYEQVLNFKSTLEKMLSENSINGNSSDYIQLVPITENLIDKIWGDFEPVPSRPSNDLILLDESYHGEEFSSKRSRILKKLSSSKKSNDDSKIKNYFVTVALDEICWLLNLRGSEIDFNPVFYAYLLIDDQSDETILFTDSKYDDKIKQYFESNRIVVKPYDQFWESLSGFVTEATNDATTFIVPDNSSWQLIREVSKKTYKMLHSPVDVLKSVKNVTEIANAHRAQVLDSVCLTQYFAWLEDRLIQHEALIDEYTAAEKLTEIRKTKKTFIGNSFDTISSTGANAAVIHYKPPKENSSMINPQKIYLCDSGSQFLEGTTDITRTIHLDKPTEEEIKNYTLVLKGNLALERLIFPEGTNGYQIDVIARQYLWEQGLDYRHGTGHGIGAMLNVHEGPIGIGTKPTSIKYPLQAGNIISNEPGYYKDGEYGIRIENDLLVEVVKPEMRFGDKKFLCFENITLVPYCRKLIDVKMLDKREREQINEYHRKIFDTTVQFTQPQSISFKWLKRETAPL